MGGFEYLEHPADLGVIGRGDDLGEALAWVSTGMFSYMADLDAVAPAQTIQVELSSRDTEALAGDCLNELLYRYEADGLR